MSEYYTTVFFTTGKNIIFNTAGQGGNSLLPGIFLRFSRQKIYSGRKDRNLSEHMIVRRYELIRPHEKGINYFYLLSVVVEAQRNQYDCSEIKKLFGGISVKKVVSFIMALAFMLCCFTACGKDEKNSGSLPEGTLTEIVDEIYKSSKPEFNTVTIDVDINDADALKAYTGLDSSEQISEVVASESALGAQAYSLVLVRLKDSANAGQVAERMRGNIDRRKWICVEADQIRVCAGGDVVMLIMMSSEFYTDNLSVDKITEAFKELCGGTLSVDLV